MLSEICNRHLATQHERDAPRKQARYDQDAPNRFKQSCDAKERGKVNRCAAATNAAKSSKQLLKTMARECKARNHTQDG